MIVIVGSMIDDILYFLSKMKNRKEVIIFKKYRIFIGTILNRPVCLIGDIYTDYMTTAILTHVIEKYHAILIFSVGKCRSFGKFLKHGEIVISRQIYLGDVNQVGLDKNQLGQVPSLEPFYLCDSYVTSIVKQGALAVAPDNFSLATFVSTNKYEKHYKDLESITSENSVFGHKKHVVIDSETGGVSVVSTLYDIPMIAIKVVEGEVDEKLTDEHIFDALKQYPTIGKIVTFCIGEIGRSDMM